MWPACWRGTVAWARSGGRGSCSRPRARTTRAIPPPPRPTAPRSKKRSSAPTRSWTTTTSTPTPTPTSEGRASPKSANRATRPMKKARPSSATCRPPAWRPTANSPPANRTCTAKSTPPPRSRTWASRPKRKARGRPNEALALVAAPRRDPGQRTRAHESDPLRDRLLGHPRDRHLLRLHQEGAVQTRLPAPRGVQHGCEHKRQVARARRGRRRGPGHSHQPPGQRRRGDHGNQLALAADPLRRDDEDPAAHLLGRQLVRRTAAGEPVGADAALGRHGADHAH